MVLNLGSGDGVDAGSVLAVYQRGEEIDDRFIRNPNAPMPEPDAAIEYEAAAMRITADNYFHYTRLFAGTEQNDLQRVEFRRTLSTSNSPSPNYYQTLVAKGTPVVV